MGAGTRRFGGAPAFAPFPLARHAETGNDHAGSIDRKKDQGMTISLYAATIPSTLQILGSVKGLLDKGEAFVTEHGLDPNDIIQARLADDMLPFAYQVKSAATHSIGAINGVRAGNFSPNMEPPPTDFAGLHRKIDDAISGLSQLTTEEMSGFLGKPMTFTIGDRLRLDFVAEQFLLSFSQPNFYFHATTAYAILRGKGVPIGKRDFMGAMRLAG